MFWLKVEIKKSVLIKTDFFMGECSVFLKIFLILWGAVGAKKSGEKFRRFFPGFISVQAALLPGQLSAAG